MKRGIVELADIVIVINKADGDLAPAAARAVADYRHAIGLLRPIAGERADVVAVSALRGEGIDTVRALIERRAAALAASGALERRRAQQAQAALWREIGEGLIEALKEDADVARHLASARSRRRRPHPHPDRRRPRRPRAIPPRVADVIRRAQVEAGIELSLSV